MEKLTETIGTLKQRPYLVASVAIVAAYLAGRYTAPTRVETQTETEVKTVEVVKTVVVEVEKRVEMKSKQKIVERTTQYNADGSWLQKERETEAETARLEQENTRRFEENVDRAASRRASEKKVTETRADSYYAGALLAPGSYGAELRGRLAKTPLWLGVQGTYSMQHGLQLHGGVGVTF